MYNWEDKIRPMQPTQSVTQKLRQLLIIFGPIIVTQIALSAMNTVDTMMSGRFAQEDLAGVAIGSSLWIPVQTGLSGILLALTPIVSQLLGAKRKERISFSVFQGLYLAVILALLVLLVGSFVVRPFLQMMQLEDDVRRIAYRYLIGLAWGIVPLFFYTVLRSFMDALGQTRFTMAITLASFPINVLFNYALIFGAWGFPRLGGAGSGYATSITYWFIMLIACYVVWRKHPFARYEIFSHLHRISLESWQEQLRIGFPIGIAIFCEVSIFSAVALLMSPFGTTVIAAHQAAINFSALLYMIPMSVSLALTIAVGYEVGAERVRDAFQYISLGIGLSVLMAVVSGVALLFNRETVAGFYTNDPDVLSLTYAFLVYVIFFQLSDALAAPIQGALRGFKDVNVPLLLSLFAYWVVGLPVGFALTRFTSFGPASYWIGLICGLAMGALGLFWRLSVIRRKEKAMTATSSQSAT